MPRQGLAISGASTASDVADVQGGKTAEGIHPGLWPARWILRRLPNTIPVDVGEEVRLRCCAA